MKRGRVSLKTKNRFKHAIQDLIKGLGRKVKVYKQPIKSECSNCFYDKLTNSSTGKCKWTALEVITKQQEYEVATSNIDLRYKFFKVGRCPICKGKGYVESQRSVWISCLVIWNPDDRNRLTFTPAGHEGSTIVELKTDPKYFDLFKNCTKVVIDDISCLLSASPALRGLGNKSVLIITAFTTDKLGVDQNEILKTYSGI